MSDSGGDLTSTSERLEFIDSLRGFALFGVFWANLLIFSGMFYGFARGPALMGKVGPASLMALAVVGFALQMVCARVWLKWFRFGPAEWLWRSLTYWKLQPFGASTAVATRTAPAVQR